MAELLLKYPLRAFLDLSTAHLSPATRELLDNYAWRSTGSRLPYGARMEFGWLVWVPSDEGDDSLWSDVPRDLWACLMKARELGGEYVLFDADAEADEDLLPVFEDARV